MVGLVPGICDAYDCPVTAAVEMTMVAGVSMESESEEFKYCYRHALGVAYYTPHVDWLEIEGWKIRHGTNIPHPEFPLIPWPEETTEPEQEEGVEIWWVDEDELDELDEEHGGE